MAVNDADQSNKAHRTRQSGAKSYKKSKNKKKHDAGEDQKTQNPKAFAFSSSNKAKRLQSRAVEKEQRRLHVPIIDRSYGEPPPYVVLVQGPPQVHILFFLLQSSNFTTWGVLKLMSNIALCIGPAFRLESHFWLSLWLSTTQSIICLKFEVQLLSYQVCYHFALQYVCVFLFL